MKNLDKVMENINKALSMIDSQIKEKVAPLLKGYESILAIVIVMMILVGLSSKMVVFGVITLAVLLSPKYLPGIMAKMNKKEEPKQEDKTDESKKE